MLEAKSDSHPVDSPVNAEALSETFERGILPVAEDQPAPECFVCGKRSGGLRIAPRYLLGMDLWTTAWQAGDSVSSDDVNADDHVVWGVLDCPAGFAVAGYGIRRLEFFPALTDPGPTASNAVAAKLRLYPTGELDDKDEMIWK